MDSVFLIFENDLSLTINVLASSYKVDILYEFNHHIETSPLICRTNQWTGFYMIGISVMKELNIC